VGASFIRETKNLLLVLCIFGNRPPWDEGGEGMTEENLRNKNGRILVPTGTDQEKPRNSTATYPRAKRGSSNQSENARAPRLAGDTRISILQKRFC